MNCSRRAFSKITVLAGAATAWGLAANGQSVTRRKVKLGLDNFSVRAMGWKAAALIEYAASLKTDSLFITDLDAFDNHSDGYLKEVRARAADKGLEIQLGTWSIC